MRIYATLLFAVLNSGTSKADDDNPSSASSVVSDGQTATHLRPSEGLLAAQAAHDKVEPLIDFEELSDAKYDCDADGEDECGSFNHNIATGYGCRDHQQCRYKNGVGGTMSQNCICRKCFDKGDTAAVHVPYDFEDIYQSRFRSWARIEWTCGSWVLPRNDKEILDVLAYARDNGYKIRPSGSSHSTGGLVTGADDASYNVIALSLGNYVAPGGWEYELKEVSKGDATVIVNAGWSQLQLYQKIRPLDYMLPAATSGPLFQLGGLVANSCHGGWFEKGFIHEYVVSMRVITYDGTSKVISDEDELKFWRNSYGLLGIITSMEFKLDYNPKFQQDFIKSGKFAWNEANFWKFIKQDASADLPDEVGGPGPQEATSGQYFIDAYGAADGEASMTAVVMRKNEHAVKDYDKPLNIKANYKYQYIAPVLDEDQTAERRDGRPPYHVYGKYGDLIKQTGGPDVLPWDDISSVNNAMARDHRGMTKTGMNGPGILLSANSLTVKDGYFATKVPQVLYSAYFIDAKDAFKVLDDMAKIYKRLEDEDAPFKWNGPPELRFIRVADDAVLNLVPAGLYAVVEPIAFPYPEFEAAEWNIFYSLFLELEELFLGKYNGKPHIAKVHGIARGSDGVVRPYQLEESCKVYTDEQKQDFLDYKKTQDPEELFEGGDAMKLLSECP